MCSFESELYPSDLWGNSMFSFEFELCHSNLWEEMAYSLLCLAYHNHQLGYMHIRDSPFNYLILKKYQLFIKA
jgi:hypothetical protein